MKISLEWLKDYVALPGSADVLAEALTNAGTEVIGRDIRGEVPDKVVVAQILASEQHPNADRLSVCQVDDGSGHPRQIVCGAKNYKVGDKVPLALPGAVLGPDFKIKAGKLRGVTSDGMLCSAKELALADDADGLLILPADLPVGKAVKDIFSPDTVLELEVTPNRPDLLGYLGLAREVGAVSGEVCQMPPVPAVPSKPAGEAVRFDDAGCPFYTARIIRGVKVGPSPQWLADRLTAIGLRPINNVVDVTNYVLFETGQPLHAFDRSKLEGGVVIRSAREGELLPALDGSQIKLRPHDLVIADDKKPVALAGVMGGSETGVSDTTTDLLLESAWFEPSRIRKSSRELGISTDSSYRFERRVDPEGVLAASARATDLILQMAGGAADPVVLVGGEAPAEKREVALDPERCRALLGLEVSDGEIDDILRRLGLIKSSGGWIIPGFRPDLARPVDLCEEVIRMVGIERVPSRLRGFPAAASVADLRHDNAERLRERLRAQGFSEARTSHFVSPEVLSKAGGGDAAAVKIRNPLGADQALLRPSLLTGLLEALARNLRHGIQAVRLFELGQIFSSAEPEERTALALIVTGSKQEGTWQESEVAADFYDLKGVLGAVCGPLDFAARAGGVELSASGPGISGAVRRLSHDLASSHGAKSPVYYAELVVDGWLAAAPAAVRVRELPKFPPVQRDLSLILPSSTSFAVVDKALRGAKIPHLESVALADVFTDSTGVKIGGDQRVLTVTLTFRESGRTLTSDEVDRAVATLRDHARAELGAAFRE